MRETFYYLGDHGFFYCSYYPLLLSFADGQRQDHVTPFYDRVQILKLKDLYAYEVAKLRHKNSRKKLPNGLNCHFTPSRAIHTRTTRLASSELNSNLYLPRYRTQKLRARFKYQAAKI